MSENNVFLFFNVNKNIFTVTLTFPGMEEKAFFVKKAKTFLSSLNVKV